MKWLNVKQATRFLSLFLKNVRMFLMVAKNYRLIQVTYKIPITFRGKPEEQARTVTFQILGDRKKPRKIRNLKSLPKQKRPLKPQHRMNEHIPPKVSSNNYLVDSIYYSLIYLYFISLDLPEQNGVFIAWFHYFVLLERSCIKQHK